MTRRARSGAKISAVVSDVDGTLVTDDKTLTPASRAAVAELSAAGIAFTVVSSRPPRGLRDLVATLGITAPVAGFNGGVIAEPNSTVLAAHPLSPDTARRSVAMLDEKGVDAWVFAGEDWLLRRADDAYVGLEKHTVGFEPKVVADFGPSLDRAAKIVGVSADFEHLARCEAEIRPILADEATVARSQPYYLDITHPLANKGVALTRIAALLRVPLTEIAVVGDGANDVAMFERAGFSIAMGNAGPDVRQAADCVTASNGEDGFAAAVEHFVLGAARSAGTPMTTAQAGDRI